MKLYEKPKIDVCLMDSEDIMAVSGGLTDSFTKITGSEANSIDVGNLK